MNSPFSIGQVYILQQKRPYSASRNPFGNMVEFDHGLGFKKGTRQEARGNKGNTGADELEFINFI
jgi:hypothetical protein